MSTATISPPPARERPKQLLRQGNSNLKRDNIWVFTLPALYGTLPDGTTVVTCPQAGTCALVCYARSPRSFIRCKVRAGPGLWLRLSPSGSDDTSTVTLTCPLAKDLPSDALLSGTEGNMRPELEPVRAALSAVAPATGVNWAARAVHQRLLRQLTELTGPVTHDTIGKLTPPNAAERLRTMLIDHGALPVRDERLISAERSVKRRIERVENAEDRKILGSFATWHHLRRLRAIAERRPLTEEQVTYSINALTAAANLLNWLRERGQSLAECTQSDIDEWLLDHDTFSRTRGFVTWTVERGYAHGIEVPRAKNDLVREVFGDHDQRWALARRLLTDEALALPERVAGLLVLLYAQRVAKVTRLTTGHVTINAENVEIALGECPITVPPEFGTLITRLIAERTDDTVTEASESIWLFPGAKRGQPASSRALLRSLAALGVPATIGRNTALMELAGEMPAAIISGLLGIHLQRATTWTHDAGNTRPGYAAELARRNGAPHTPASTAGADE